MSFKRTLWSGVTSYGQLLSIVVTTLVSVPLAFQFLTPEEFGLWSFASQAVGYLLLMDFGVSSSVGRLMAEPLHRQEQKEINKWFTLNAALLAGQGALFLGVGLSLVEKVVHWFQIPPHLHGEAVTLLSLLVVTSAIAHPFRICTGILIAQNRAYCANFASVLSIWVNLVAFSVCLYLGHRSVSYGYAVVISTGVHILASIVMLRNGPDRFGLARVQWQGPEIRQLFSFSSGVFFIGIAVQVVLMSQSLVLAKVAGLGAVAAFNISTKAGMLLMQVLWRPFDAFIPRWQEFLVREQGEHLCKEFSRMARTSICLALGAVTCLLALNQLFVIHWARPDLYVGPGFDFLLAVYVLVQTFNHCLSSPFILFRDSRSLAWNATVEAAFNVGLSIWAAARFGAAGVLLASVICSLVISAGWIGWRGPRYLRTTLTAVFRPAGPLGTQLCLFLAVAALYNLLPIDHPGIGLGTAVVLVSTAATLWAIRADILFIRAKLRRQPMSA